MKDENQERTRDALIILVTEFKHYWVGSKKIELTINERNSKGLKKDGLGKCCDPKHALLFMSFFRLLRVNIYIQQELLRAAEIQYTLIIFQFQDEC